MPWRHDLALYNVETEPATRQETIIFVNLRTKIPRVSCVREYDGNLNISIGRFRPPAYVLQKLNVTSESEECDVVQSEAFVLHY